MLKDVTKDVTKRAYAKYLRTLPKSELKGLLSDPRIKEIEDDLYPNWRKTIQAELKRR